MKSKRPPDKSPHEITNERLRLEHLPSPEDDQTAWIRFALTFDGYAEMGTQETCARFANKVRMEWEQNGELPYELNELRTALFWEQRRWRWSDEKPFTDKQWLYWRSLVDAIRRLLSSRDQVRDHRS